jgi:hypothetical protein
MPPRVWITLSAQGIEIDVAAIDPFTRRYGGAPDPLKLRLVMRPAPASCKIELGVMETPEATAFATRRLAALQQDLNKDAPLRWEIAPEVGAFAWPLDRSGDVWMATNGSFSLAPEKVRATLLSDPTSAGLLPQAARFTPTTVVGVIRSEREVTLTLRSGAAAAAATPRLDLGWTSRDDALKINRAGLARDYESELDAKPIPAFASTGELRERLAALYAERGLRPTDDKGPVYAFLPLARGMLQLPLPLPLPAPLEKQQQPSAGGAMAGTVRARYASGAAAATFSIAGAAGLYAETIVSAGGPTVTLRLLDPVATIDGLLWACAAPPAGGEALPTVIGGQASLTAVPCLIGRAGAAGFALLFDVAQSILMIVEPSGPARIATEAATNDIPFAWTAHPRLPLIATMPMTRARPSLSPSATRDLAPGAVALPVSLAWRQEAFPILVGPPGPLAPSGWPLPNIGVKNENPEEPELRAVSLTPLTMPGIELAPQGDVDDPFGRLSVSLRFDLPILGEFFAGVGSPAGDPALDAKATALDLKALCRAWTAAAGNLALTRTMGDRVTGWLDASETGTTAKVTELMLPFIWNARLAWRTKAAAGDLPLGSYALVNSFVAAGDWRTPSQALAGLGGRFSGPNGADRVITLDPNGSLPIIGFSPAMRRDGALLLDARGQGLAALPDSGPAQTPRLRRARGDADSASDFRLATVPAIDLDGIGIGGQQAHGLAFEARDLPVTGDGPFTFKADPLGLVDDELRTSQHGGGLNRAGFRGALMEWRLFEKTIDAGKRPRFTIALGPFVFRPLRLMEASVATGGALESLTVIGSVELKGLEEQSGLLPFDDDAPYASGNLTALTWRNRQLASVEDVTKAKKDGVETGVVALGAAGKRLSFAIDVMAMGRDPSEARLPFRLEATLGCNGGKAVLSEVSLIGPLFGAETNLVGGSYHNDPHSPDSLAFSYAFPRDGDVNKFHVDAVKIMRRLDSGDWDLSIDGFVDLAVTGAKGKAAPSILRLGAGATTRHRIFDASLTGLTCSVDHARGAISWSMPKQPMRLQVLRGLTIAVEHFFGEAMLALALAPKGAQQKAGEVFSRDITAGLAAFTDKDSAVALTLRLGSGPTGLSCSGVATLSLPGKGDSLVEWPISTASAVEATGYASVIVAAGAQRLRHGVTLSLMRLPVPLASLARDGADTPLYLKGPWRARAACKHTLSVTDNGPTLAWDTIEEISVHDWATLRADATAEVVGYPESRKPPVKPSSYAFAPRYQLDFANPELIASAGIVGRHLAGAGFPPRQLQKRFSDLNSNPDAASDGLVVAGGSLAEIAWGAGRAMLALPWFYLCGQPEGDAALANLKAALTVRQRPEAGELKVVLSGDEATDGPPPPAARALAFDVRDGAAASVARGFRDIGLDPPQAMIGTSAFSNSPDYLPAGETAEQVLDPSRRPMFLRAMLALARIWAAGPPADISVLTLFGASGALACLAVRRSKVSPPAEVTQLAVLTRTNVIVAPLDSDPARLSWQVRTVTPAPLALLTVISPAGAEAKDEAPYTGADPRPLPGASAPQLPGRRLRAQDQWIAASRALGWPVAASWPSGVDTALALGDETPVQDLAAAWSGRARIVATARKAFPAGTAAIFLAAGHRTLFPQAESGLAPPDSALAVAPPRARAPLASALATALRAAGGDPDHLVSFLPGPIELVSAGGRAGTLGLDHHGLVVAEGGPEDELAFDLAFPRFGRAAHRGPVVAAALRQPRSSALPRVTELGQRRRTFVAENFVKGTDLLQHVAFRGAMAILRASGKDLDGAAAGSSQLIGVRLTCSKDAMVLDGTWTGALVLDASAPRAGARLATWLARLGFRGDGQSDSMRADLVVGTASFPFDRLVMEAQGAGLKLTLTMESRARDAALALAGAAPDDTVRLVLRLAVPTRPDEVDPAGPSTLTLAKTPETKLLGGPAPRRVVTLPLQRGVSVRNAPRVSVVSVAFGDPAHDRQLASATKAQTTVEDGVTWLLALDRAEYDCNATVHLAAGPLAAAAAAGSFPEPIHFSPAGAATELKLAINAIAPQSPGQPPPLLRPLVLDGVEFDADKKHRLSACAAVAIPLAALRDATNVPAVPADLPAGYRLSFAITGHPSNTPLMANVGVVEGPVLAAAEAAYGLVGLGKALDGTDGPRLEASLFASAPLPDVIEFPDLLADLALGRVRRRALFQWRCPEAARLAEMSLVKYDRTGGGQLPDSEEDFQPIEE